MAVAEGPFDEAARLLAQRSRRRLSFAPDFHALAPTEPRGDVIAVDGSHAVLVDNGSVWVVAVRAAAVPWGRPSWIAPPPQVHAATPATADDVLAERYAALGIAPPPARTALGFAEALREAAEIEQTLGAIAAARRDDIVLIDGALEALPPGPQAAAGVMLAAAQRDDAPALVAVAKRSGIEAAGVFVVPALHAAGPEGAWSTQLPGYSMVHVARLHAASRFAFRVDTTTPGRLPELAWLARDAVYLGYPYPLARAHNAVVITAGHARSLRTHLVDAVRLAGGAEAYRLLEDFHATLDVNTP